MNPGWKVHVLSRTEWQDWLPASCIDEFNRLRIIKHAHQTDWLRLQLLNAHGGIWADATTICRQPLESWLPADSRHGFFAFRNTGTDRLLANWFIASIAGHPLLARWLRGYSKCLRLPRPLFLPTLQNKLRHRLKQHIQQPKATARIWCHPLTAALTAHLPYYCQHYCFAEALRRNPSYKHIWNAVPVREAGPCHWLQHHAHETVTSDSLSRLNANNSPVFKLNWRRNTCEQPMIKAEFERHGLTG
jgi:hypothetical protein